MAAITELKYLLYIFLPIIILAGTGIIFCYGFPKVKNSEDIYTLLPSQEWTPEKLQTYRKTDLISRLGVSLLVSGTLALLLTFGIHSLLP